MNRLSFRPIDLAALAACTGLMEMHEARPGIAGMASYVAIALAWRRAIALIACTAIALGLIAAAEQAPPTPRSASHGPAAR